MQCRFGHVTCEDDSTLTRSLRLHSSNGRWWRGVAIARQALILRLEFVDIISRGKLD